MEAFDIVSVKVPADARDLIVQVAKLVREAPGFSGHLKSAIEEFTRPSVAVVLEQVLHQLEVQGRRLDAMDAELQEGGKEFTGPDPDWFTGSGLGRRLTPVGENELVRLFQRGLSDKQISRRMGMSFSTISTRRKRHELEQMARSGDS